MAALGAGLLLAAPSAGATDTHCDQEIARSGADQDLLDSSIAVSNYGDGSTRIRDLICAFSGEKDRHLTFRSEGMLMWSKQLMEIHMDGRNEVAPMEIVRDDETGHWKVVAWTEEAPADARRIDPALVTACMMKTANSRDCR